MGALGKLNKSVQGAANQKALQQETQQDMAVGQAGGAAVAQAQQQTNVPGNAQALAQGGGGEDVDPKLKRAMEDYQTVMMQVLHAPETRDGVVDMLSSAPAAQSVPATTLQINDMVESKVAKSSGQPVDAAVKVAGAVYVVQDLVEMGNQGGFWEQEVGEEEMGFLLEESMKQYIHRGLADGSIDPVELQQSIEPMMNDTQMEVGGMIAQEAGLPKAPTAGMGVNKIVSDKTRPLEEQNRQLKGQLGMEKKQNVQAQAQAQQEEA